MRAPSSHRSRQIAVAVLASLTASAVVAADDRLSTNTPLMYRLTSDPLAEQSLLAGRWAPPSLSLRLEAAAGLGGAHELRVLGSGITRLAPQLGGPGDADMRTVLDVEPVRATYRYTLLAEPNWAVKLGLSANLRETLPSLRMSLISAESQQFGSLPLLHVAGEGQWTPRWRLAFALDGLTTGRGRALDLGVSVNYLWSRGMSVYGGYQLTDAVGDAEGYYGVGLSNRANIGVRYRF
jgi:hypothetical protein